MLIEDPHELVRLLDEVVAQGSPSYRTEAAEAATVTVDEILDRLDDEGRRLLLRWEEERNRDAARTADDHWRLGYVIGSSGVVDRLVAHGLLADPG